MTRFEKIYGDYACCKKRKKEKILIQMKKVNHLNREGYGYIKRRVGLLSNEVKSPTYFYIQELAEYINKDIKKD